MKHLIIIHGTAYMVSKKYFIEASKLCNYKESEHSAKQHDEHRMRIIAFSDLIASLYVPLTNNIPTLMW